MEHVYETPSKKSKKSKKEKSSKKERKSRSSRKESGKKKKKRKSSSRQKEEDDEDIDADEEREDYEISRSGRKKKKSKKEKKSRRRASRSRSHSRSRSRMSDVEISEKEEEEEEKQEEVKELDSSPEEEEPKPKRRGRPKKSDSDNDRSKSKSKDSKKRTTKSSKPSRRRRASSLSDSLDEEKEKAQKRQSKRQKLLDREKNPKGLTIDEIEAMASNPRKWNDKDTKSKKMGKFTDTEIEILKKSLCSYVQRKAEGEEYLLKLCCSKASKETKGAWTIIASCLPERSIQSCHNLCRRKFNIKNYKGDWTLADEQTLVDFVTKYGHRWEELGDLLDRTANNVKDKWKQMGGENFDKKRSGHWKVEELLLLIKLIEKDQCVTILKEKIKLTALMELNEDGLHFQEFDEDSDVSARDSHKVKEIIDRYVNLSTIEKLPLKDINWTVISQILKTRSADDCRKKWHRQVYGTLTDTNYFNQDDDLYLVREISKQGPEDESEINFKAIENDRTAEQNKDRWKRLCKSLGKKKSIVSPPLEEIIEELLDYFESTQDYKENQEIEDQNDIVSYFRRHFSCVAE